MIKPKYVQKMVSAVQKMIYYSHLERVAKDELFDIDRLGLEEALKYEKMLG